MAKLQRGPSTFEQDPEIGVITELTRADLTHLTEKRTPTSIQTLRDSHHRIARAVASGMSNLEVATVCGISYNRVSMLRSDPAFVDLVAHYRGILTAEWAAEADPVTEHLRSNALKAQAMLSDKLDEAAEKGEFLPTRDLLGIAELGLDRTGYGKVNKNLNVNVDFAAKLEDARKRSDKAKVIREIGAPPLAPTGEQRARLEVGKSLHPHASSSNLEIALGQSTREAALVPVRSLPPSPRFARRV